MDSDPKKIRTALLTFSTIIIIYVIGGGRLIQNDGTGKAEILGGSITFDKPYILESSVIFIFVYLVYRYYLSIKPTFITVIEEIYTALLASPRYTKILHKYYCILTRELDQVHIKKVEQEFPTLNEKAMDSTLPLVE